MGSLNPEPLDSKKDNTHAYDFRNQMILTAPVLRKFKLHQEEFVQSTAARLSIHLRLEFSLKLIGVKTIPYQKLADSWGQPAHLTVFKTEPLRGVSVLEISTQLGLCMVDRLMGGSGVVASSDQEISEIEKVLLEQTVELFLHEWCSHWSKIKELKPVILGYESNGRFIQAAPMEATMLVVIMEASFGECSGQIQLGVPFAAMEPLIQTFCGANETATVSAPVAKPAAPARLRWNTCFDEVPVPVTAEWEGLELTARQILALKVGDVLKLEAKHAQRVKVRVADAIKFEGRPGTSGGQWAVELTKIVNR